MPTDLQVAPRKITSVNPATGQVIREFEPVTEAEVAAAVVSARAAQPGWHRLGVRQRIGMLNRFRRLLQDKKSDIARLITAEAGKPQVEALLTEVMVVLDAARFYSENSYAFLCDRHVPHANLVMKTKSGRLVREPYGVIGIISPWNYPFSIPATETLAALIAGNAVVLSPQSSLPRSRSKLRRCSGKRECPERFCRSLWATGARAVHSWMQRSTNWYLPEVWPPASASLRLRRPGYSRWCLNLAARTPCWFWRTPTLTLRRAARFGEHS